MRKSLRHKCGGIYGERNWENFEMCEDIRRPEFKETDNDDLYLNFWLL